MSLKLKNTKGKLVTDLGEGILVQQQVSFNIKSEEDLKNWMFLKSLLETEEEFIKKYIEVVLEEIE
jgi:hypothetical protein